MMLFKLLQHIICVCVCYTHTHIYTHTYTQGWHDSLDIWYSQHASKTIAHTPNQLNQHQDIIANKKLAA